MHKLFWILILFVSLKFNAQLDYAKKITQTLCSPEFHGRGYVAKGDSIASEYIASEFKALGLAPVKGNYFQTFTHNVNTFPGKMEIKAGDRTLQPGIDFLIDPSSPGGIKNLNPILINYELIKNEPQFIWTIKHVLKDKTHDAFVFDFSTAPKDSVKDYVKFSRDFITVSKMPVFLVTEDKFTWSVADDVMLAPYILLKPGTREKRSHWILIKNTRSITTHAM
jgi:aminopeptidase YwaD